MYFIRHGISLSNAHGYNLLSPEDYPMMRYYLQFDPPLSQIGIKNTTRNAKKLLPLLNLPKDTVFMASQLTRAIETCHLIAKEFNDENTPPIIMAPFLREHPSLSGECTPRPLANQLEYLASKGITVNDTMAKYTLMRESEGDIKYFLNWLVSVIQRAALTTSHYVIVSHNTVLFRFLGGLGATDTVLQNNECWKLVLVPSTPNNTWEIKSVDKVVYDRI